MKNVLLFILSIFPLFCYANKWDGISSDTNWYSENQTEFYIKTEAQLKGLADLVNSGEATFEGKKVFLLSDLDMNNYTWEPIGNSFGYVEKPFSGTFNGNGYTINNLNYTPNTINNDYLLKGLFGYVNKGTIENLQLNSSCIIDINSAKYSITIWIGAVVGYGIKSNIYNVTSEMEIKYMRQLTDPKIYTGGISGYMRGGSIEQCKVKYNISNSSTVYEPINGCIGGIVGSCSDTDIKECSTKLFQQLYINGYRERSDIGGIAGNIGNSSISNCISLGSITCNIRNSSNLPCIGGIVGTSIGLKMNDCISATYIIHNLPNTYHVGAIHGLEFDNSEYSNLYYLKGIVDKDIDRATPIENKQLTSGCPLDKLDSNIWGYKKGEYPYLQSLVSTYPITLSTENGDISTFVREGETYKAKIIPLDEWEIDQIFVNGVNQTENLNGQLFESNPITEKTNISILYKKLSSTQIQENVFNDQFNISILNNKINVSNVKIGSHINIYNISGMVVKQLITQKEDINIELEKGVYIVQIEKESIKVAL